nr:YpmS family protein [Listeria sp. PSOL-1]
MRRGDELKSRMHLHQKRNVWKWISLLLIAGILIFLIWVYLATFIFSPTKEESPVVRSRQKTVAFTSKTTKADLNQLIATYIDDFKKEQDLDYQVHIANQVIFTAKIKFLSQTADLKLTFSPKVVKGGNVELMLKSVSIGALTLPVSYVMSLVNSSYSFPDWVTVIPKQEKIYLALDRLKLDGGVKVRMNTLNLKKDDLSFTLLVPVK